MAAKQQRKCRKSPIPSAKGQQRRQGAVKCAARRKANECQEKARQREKHMPRPANQHKACRPGHNFILSAWQYQRCQPHHFNGPNAATGQRKTPWPRPPMPLIPPPSAPDGDIRPAPPRATQGRPRVAPGGSRQEKPSGKTPLGRSTASTSA